VAFSTDGESILSGSYDGTVKVWNREPRSHGEILVQKDGWLINSSNFSPDSRRLATYDFDGNLTVWDVPQRRPLAKLGSKGRIATFSPNGRILAQALWRTIKLWDAATLLSRGELTNGFDAISLSFSPNSLTLATAGLTAGGMVLDGITNRLSFWDLTTNRKIEKLAAAAPLAVMVSFSHDGRLVAVGYLGGQVRIWDYQTEKLIKEFTEQHQRIWAVAFSPDDSWLVAGGWDGVPFFYNVRTRRTVRPLTGTSTWVAGLCFAPDGKTLASAEGDGTLNLWNVATREIALTLRGHTGWLSVGPCFSPDGTLLVTSGIDGTVRLWPATSWEEIANSERKQK
jgi:WD40 repeat protein